MLTGADAPLCRAVLSQYDAFKWMGCAIIFVACVGVAPLYFPMWGGLFCGPQPGVTEEDYYYAEYSPAEREKGMHLAASNFVRSRSHAQCTGKSAVAVPSAVSAVSRHCTGLHRSFNLFASMQGEAHRQDRARQDDSIVLQPA